MRGSLQRVSLGLACCLAVGCDGFISGHALQSGGSGSTGPSTTITPAGPSLPAPLQVPRLTRTQYVNTVNDVFGAAAAAAAADVLTEEIGDKDHSYRTMRAATDAFFDVSYEQLDTTAWSIAQVVFSDDTARAALLGCTPATPSDACVQSFLNRVPQLLYRRALSTDELASYAQLISDVTNDESGNVLRGLEAATAALLESPDFVYRGDVGVPVAGRPGIVRYTSIELGGRLALLLWDSGPDAELLSVAANGALDDDTLLQAQVTRLLADPRAARGIGAFATDYFDTDRLDDMAKDPVAFPEWGPALIADMRQEISLAVSQLVLTHDDDFMNVFTTRDTFLNGTVATLYGVPGVTGAEFVSYTFPDNWVHQTFDFGGFLSAHSGAVDHVASAPIRRGLILNERILCNVFGAPPANAQDVASAQLMNVDSSTMTTRQLTQDVTSLAQCQGCHAQINPLGFALENFDALGHFRSTELGQPIDASGTVDGQAFTTPMQLGQIFRDDATARACVVKQLYSYATGHTPVAAEQPALDAMDVQFVASGRRLTALIGAMVSSDAFRLGQSSP